MPKMQSWLSDAVVPVRAEILRVFEQEWTRLSAPGSFWSGSERVAVAATNRRSRFEGPELDGRLPAAAGDAASLLGAHPAEATREWVEEKTAALGEAAYVELVGVVSRTAAIDSFHVALGAKLPLLPEPVAGDPDGVLDQRAAAGAAWVPMVGGASIVYALSLVPAEFHAQEEMHGPLYLTYEGMQDLKFERGLTRTQMELVAARTSAVNECFYWVLAHSLMLRASAEATDTDLDPRFVTDAAVDPLIPNGALLLRFVDAVLANDGVAPARDRVLAAVGAEGLVDAAGVIANFEMMNRIADGTGMPVGKGSLARTEEFRALTGIDRFRH